MDGRERATDLEAIEQGFLGAAWSVLALEASREWPSMNSIHTPTRSSARSAPKTVTTLWLVTRARERASATTRSAVPSATPCSSFSATWRSRTVSQAR